MIIMDLDSVSVQDPGDLIIQDVPTFDFAISFNDESHIVPEAISRLELDQDMVRVYNQAEHTQYDKQAVSLPYVVWNSSRPTVATISDIGYIEHKSSGNTIISGTARGITHTSQLTFPQIPDQVLVDYTTVDETIRKVFVDQLKSLLVPNKDKALFTVFPSDPEDTEAIYVRNPDCWIAAIDTTAWSPWNDVDGPGRGGLLISPLHAINATHYTLWPGDKIRFVGMLNQVCERTIVNSVTIGPAYGQPGYIDTQLLTLDSPVDSFIHFAKVLPANYINYFPNGLSYTPTVWRDGHNLHAVLNPLGGTWWDTWDEYTELAVAGDSGSPCGFIFNGTTICARFVDGAGASILVPHYDEFNAQMSPYTLTQLDLSTYRSF